LKTLCDYWLCGVVYFTTGTSCFANAAAFWGYEIIGYCLYVLSCVLFL